MSSWGLAVCALLGQLAPGTSATVAPFSGFQEANFVTQAEPDFVTKCVPDWQEECRSVYAHNTKLQHELCETHLDRNYIKIRTLVPETTILDQWAWDKERRDYDIGICLGV